MTTNPINHAPWRKSGQGADAAHRSVPQHFLRLQYEATRTVQFLCLCQITMLVLLSILVSLK